MYEKGFFIVEGGIPVGFFQDVVDRDAAFEKYFLEKNRSGFKTDRIEVV